jgi:hypothetical protein
MERCCQQFLPVGECHRSAYTNARPCPRQEVFERPCVYKRFFLREIDIDTITSTIEFVRRITVADPQVAQQVEGDPLFQDLWEVANYVLAVVGQRSAVTDPSQDDRFSHQAFKELRRAALGQAYLAVEGLVERLALAQNAAFKKRRAKVEESEVSE